MDETTDYVSEHEAARLKFFATLDRIMELKTHKGLFGLSRDEQLELDNLEAVKWQQYSDWKD